MALTIQDEQEDMLIAGKKRWWRRRPTEEESGERMLVSPLMLKRPGGRIVYWTVFVLLLLLTLLTIGPIYWMFTGGLKSSAEVLATPTFFPMNPQWGNFVSIWNVLNFPLHLTNSLLLAVGAVVLQLLVSTTAAYALSKLRPTGKGIIQFFFFGTLMVPPVVYLIPQYVNISHLPFLGVSLANTWQGVWLPEAANAFNILVLKSFIDSIPGELTDAARLDGANVWQLFTRIILPLSRPALAVTTIFTVVASWKDFVWPYLVLADDSVQPLLVSFYHQSNSTGSRLPENLLMGGLALASIPPILLFLVFQRQILRGITLTGLKG